MCLISENTFYFSNLFVLCRVINEIFAKIDEYIANETLIETLDLSALPDLYGQFVRLIEYLVSLETIPCWIPLQLWREFKKNNGKFATDGKQRGGQGPDCYCVVEHVRSGDKRHNGLRGPKVKIVLLYDLLQCCLKHTHLESSLYSLLETAHNGTYVKYDVMTPLHQQKKYFSQLRFPVYSQTEAWKEKASFSFILIHLIF